MARPRTFDRQEVLDRAMQLFWERGFEATSIQDLVECMGIGRASLYDTFGSKEALMAEAMDCYIDHMKQQLTATLHGDGPAPQVVRNLFEALVDRGAAGHTKSCLIAKSAILTGRENEAIMRRVVAFMKTVEDELYRVLCRGIEAGEIAPHKDPRALAQFFANSMQGLSITACACADRAALQRVIDVTLSVLDHPGGPCLGSERNGR